MDGWWDCDALDEMCYRALRARLEERVSLNFHTALAISGSLLFNLQSRGRAGLVGKRHYDVGNDFFESMLDPSMQYSCAWFRGTDDLAQAQREKMDLICRKLGLQRGHVAPGYRLRMGRARQTCLGTLRMPRRRDHDLRATVPSCSGILPWPSCRNPSPGLSGNFRAVRPGRECRNARARRGQELPSTTWRPFVGASMKTACFCANRSPETIRAFTRTLGSHDIFSPIPCCLLPRKWRRPPKSFLCSKMSRISVRTTRRPSRLGKGTLHAHGIVSRAGMENDFIACGVSISCCSAGAFRARSLQVFQFLFSKGGTKYFASRTGWLFPERTAHAPRRLSDRVSA